MNGALAAAVARFVGAASFTVGPKLNVKGDMDVVRLSTTPPLVAKVPLSHMTPRRRAMLAGEAANLRFLATLDGFDRYARLLGEHDGVLLLEDLGTNEEDGLAGRVFLTSGLGVPSITADMPASSSGCIIWAFRTFRAEHILFYSMLLCYVLF